MFDDVTKPNEEEKQVANDSSQGAPVEDIFSQTDEGLKSASVPDVEIPSSPSEIQAMPDNQLTPSELSSEDNSNGGKRRVLWILLIVVIIGIVVIGGYFAYNNFFNQALPDINFLDKTTEESDFDIEDSSSEPVDNTSPFLDTDNDGLFDYEEEEWGTDILRPDTDEDGLFDREEVKVYNTDPNNPDTDGDNFLDGEEVEAGYNPNGPGLLFPKTPTE